MVILNRKIVSTGKLIIGEPYNQAKKTLIDIFRYWKVDETIDGQPERFNDELVGAEGYTDVGSSFTTGIVGNSLSNNGLNIRPSLNYTTQVSEKTNPTSSISFWVYLDQPPLDRIVCSTSHLTGDEDSRFIIKYNKSGEQLNIYYYDINEDLTSSGTILTGNSNIFGGWKHIVVTIDNVNHEAKVSINNSLVSTQSIGEFGGYNKFFFGRGFDIGTSCSGKFDEVGVWNRVLDTKDIEHLYNSGNGVTYPFEI